MEYSLEYWEERLDQDVPQKVQDAIKRIYSAYPRECMPQGLCDPMYIMNIIALELGIGDGQGNFACAGLNPDGIGGLIEALQEIADLMEEQDRAFDFGNGMPFQSRGAARVAQRALASVRGKED